MRWIVILLASAGLARAEGERAGAFDYYVLALSWSPTWCALEGDGREAGQCDARHDFGWTLHGLWPQDERGWPSFCRGGGRDHSRGETGAMADIMGSGGLAWYQWTKHGRCSGLAGRAYLETARRAYESIARPDALRRLDRPVRIDPAVVEEAFLAANPKVEPGGITVTCKAGRIAEVRLCLDRNLAPRACGADVARDCALPTALLDPVR